MREADEETSAPHKGRKPEHANLGKRSGYLTVYGKQQGKYREVHLNVTAREALQNWMEVLVRPSKPLERGGRSL